MTYSLGLDCSSFLAAVDSPEVHHSLEVALRTLVDIDQAEDLKVCYSCLSAY